MGMKFRGVLSAAVAFVALLAAFSVALTLTTAHGPVAANQPGKPGSTETIKVEGNWTLEVRNRDGSVASVQHFQNDPTQAAQAISTILTRSYSPGYFWMSLGSNSANGPCISAGNPTSCILTDPNDGGSFTANSSTFKTLTTSQSGFQATITLKGSITAQRNGVVDQVDTSIWVCPSSTPPNTPCNSGAFWPFTARTLAAAIPLVTGQQLLVTVVLSFS
jgi:hypothetical protein